MPSSDAGHYYYALDLASNQTRRLDPEMQFPLGPSATVPGSPSILLVKLAGDLTKIVEVPLHGRGTAHNSERLVMDRSSSNNLELDAGPDGSLYVDDYDRPMDVLRLAASGGSPERLAGTWGSDQPKYSNFRMDAWCTRSA